ncbi:hypothetical protein [Marinoscillum sp.]|uniref:hypothetical protein n=1 Tax=Marinoscillum sp. TaxID=2024838 RepID=UPI003BAA2405
MKKILLPLILMAFLVACTEDPAEDVTKDDQEQNDDTNDDNTDDDTDDSDDDTSDDGDCHIETIVIEWDTDDKSTTTFEYDADGNIVKITDLEEWVEDGVAQSDTDVVTGEYEDGKLVSAEESEDGQVYETYEIIYDGDKIVKYIEEETEDGSIDEYRFTYEGDQVVRVENWDNYSGDTQGEFVLYSFDEFTYTNGNITSIVGEDVLEENGESYSVDITYDGKKNPLKGNLLWMLWEGDITDYISTNNALTYDEEYTYDGETEQWNTTITYEYNDAELPTKITYSDSEGDTWSYDLGYTCDED